MQLHRVLIVFGTRPEAIKMAPLANALLSRPEQFETTICVTAQHREMLDQVLRLFHIVPDYDLDIMKPGQDLHDLTARVVRGMRAVLQNVRPDIVLVHGDTTTSFAAALAAFYAGVPIGHVEAGLRTYNLRAPWPEEANRQLTARLCDFHFAPTENAKHNLIGEHISADSIVITGNTVIDALFWILQENTKNDGKSRIETEIGQAGYKLTHREIILVTGHRRENFGNGFRNICEAIDRAAQEFPEVDFVYPVHLNPNVQSVVLELLSDLPNVHLIRPLEYGPFLHLMSKAKLILTDSGGIQEEAPSLGKPVLVMRHHTERPEAVESGGVELVGTDADKIITSLRRLLTDRVHYDRMSRAVNPYGDGNASQRIIEFLLKHQ